jgi:hypothetical protein
LQNFLAPPPFPLFSTYETYESAEVPCLEIFPHSPQAVRIDNQTPRLKHNPEKTKPNPNPVMKPYTYSLLAAALACGMAQGAATAYTTPVGYVTQTLKPDIANLIGLTVHSPTVAAGVIDAESSSSVTDNEVNFTTLLTGGTTYVLELPGGVIQEVTSWTAGTLNTPQDITASVTPLTTAYKLRKASTVADVFGATNSAGILSTATGDASTCDNVLLVNASGTAFDTVFYFDDGTATGWYDLDFNEVSNRAIVYTDGLYVRRLAGSDINLVISGEVKTTPTTTVLIPGNNFAGSVYPAGSTLANSGISASLIPSTDGSTDSCDIVLLPKADGSYGTYFFFNDGTASGWYDLDFNDSNATELTSGLVVQSKSLVNKNATLSAPPSYSSL